jgi:DNA (cytosine-5)-methyltransferase 1
MKSFLIKKRTTESCKFSSSAVPSKRNSWTFGGYRAARITVVNSPHDMSRTIISLPHTPHQIGMAAVGTKEWVLVVPPQLTKTAYRILVDVNAAVVGSSIGGGESIIARPWHLEGRHGSRTHAHYDDTDTPDAVDSMRNGSAAEGDGKDSRAILDIVDNGVRPCDGTFTGDKNAPTSTRRKRMGIPVLSRDAILRLADASISEYTSVRGDHGCSNDKMKVLVELRQLLDRPLVEFVYKDYAPCTSRVLEPPHFDATIHPERRHRVERLLASTTGPPYLVDPNHARLDTKIPILSPSLLSPQIMEKRQKRHRFTYMELFAGMGGFTVALEALGGTCVFASEIDESCRSLYSCNFPHNKAVLHGDIYQVSNEQLLSIRDLVAKEAQYSTIDLLVGGFPCQPFSALGAQPGLSSDKGLLYKEIIRCLQLVQPSAFLLENVPGLLQLNDAFETIKTEFEKCGYSVFTEVLDARALLPTSRKRLYFVGLHQQLKHCQDFVFPFVPDLSLRARNVLDYGLLSNAEEREQYHISHEQLERLGREKYWRPAHLAWPNTVCNTIVSHYGRSIGRGETQLVPSSGHFVDVKTKFTAERSRLCDKSVSYPRRFTPRECARIMGFPNSFALPVSYVPCVFMGAPWQPSTVERLFRTKELYQMIGNAVCPPMIAVLVGAIFDAVLQNMVPASVSLPVGVLANIVKPSDEIVADEHLFTWLEYGLFIGIRLSYASTIDLSK